MSRLIDADELKKNSDITNWDIPYGCSFDVIDKMPTIVDTISEKSSKETAEKIYQQLQEHGTTYVKKWIKEQFGVEIKEN